MSQHCYLCGKTGVKLWRPETSIRPLICADCAEKLQVPRKSLTIKWSLKSRKGKLKYPEGYISKKMSKMDEWTISEYGTIPSAFGKDPEGKPLFMTEALCINLTSFCFQENTIIIPAILDENGIYLSRDSIYKTGQIEQWRILPNR